LHSSGDSIHVARCTALKAVEPNKPVCATMDSNHSHFHLLYP
jgi:hypothetical protein